MRNVCFPTLDQLWRRELMLTCWPDVYTCGFICKITSPKKEIWSLDLINNGHVNCNPLVNNFIRSFCMWTLVTRCSTTIPIDLLDQLHNATITRLQSHREENRVADRLAKEGCSMKPIMSPTVFASPPVFVSTILQHDQTGGVQYRKIKSMRD